MNRLSIGSDLVVLLGFSVLLGTASALPAQVELNLGGWAAPDGAWDYVYQADEDQDVDGEFLGLPGSLDETWTHNNGSDAWDGSGPGDATRPDGVTPHAPGGAGITSYPGAGEGGADASVLTIVDIGDPRSANPPFPDPSNRKVFFCHNVAQEFQIDQGLADTAFREGLTLIVRMRQPPDQDPETPGHQLMDGGIDDDAGQGAAPGYALRDGGKGGVGYYAQGLDRMFTITPHGLNGYQLPPEIAAGLRPTNFLPVEDNTKFDTMWITIEDPEVDDRFAVTIYMNGSQVPSLVLENIQFGDDTDCDGQSHLHMGFHSTPQKGSVEVDYFGYKVGLYEPFSDCPGGFIAKLDPDAGKVTGSWSPGATAGAFRILRDGAVFLDNLPADALFFEDLNPPRPSATYELQALLQGNPRPGCDFPKATVKTVVCPAGLTCAADRQKGEVALSWSEGKFYTTNLYKILRGGVQVGTAAAGQTSIVDKSVPPGDHIYELEVDSTPAAVCAKIPCSVRLVGPGSIEICDDGWDEVGVGGDVQIFATRDDFKTLYFTDGAAQDADDVATVALDVTALPGGADRATFTVEILARYEEGFRVTNLLNEDPQPFVAFSLSRTGISNAADHNFIQEAVGQVPIPPDPGTESASAALVTTKDVQLPLVLGRNILQLDSRGADGTPADGVQILCLRIGAFDPDLRATIIPNPCPNALGVVRDSLSGKVSLKWKSGQPHAYGIRRDGTEIGTLPMGGATAFVDETAAPGFHQYEVEATDDASCPILKATGGGGTPDTGGFIREWLVLGPLEWDCAANCAAPPPDQIQQDYLAGKSGGQDVDQLSILPLAGMEIELAGGAATGVRSTIRTDINPGRPAKATWFPYQAPAPTVNYNIVFGGDPGDNYVTYAATYIENTTGVDIDVEVHLSSDDAVEIFIGASSVFVNQIARGVADPTTVGDTVTGIIFPPGRTRVMVKVFEGGGDNGFWLRFEKDFLPLVDGLLVSLGTAPLEPGLRRGDADASGSIDLTDPVSVLNYLFLAGVVPGCKDAADADDSGILDLTDAIFSLNFQFLAGPVPPHPGPAVCGRDQTPDEGADLGCEATCP